MKYADINDMLNTNPRRPILLDGATGTNLLRRGMPAGVCVERWILENPSVISGLQDEYLAAGSDIILAPTFGANSVVLKRHGLEGNLRDYNLRLTELSKAAAQRAGRGFVACDVSPAGLFMRPFGDSSFDELSEVFYQQALVLEEAGADLFFIETQINLAEARAALIGIGKATKKPIFVSLTIDTNSKTMSGNPLDVCITALQAAGARAIGCNCSTGPKEMLESLKAAGKYSKVPLIAKANAGMPVTQPDGSTHYDLSPAVFADFGAEMARSGVRIVGGCCGTTPEHIGALRAKLDGVEVGEITIADDSLEYLCNEKQIFPIGRDSLNLPDNIIQASPDLADEIMDAQDDGCEAIRIRVNTEEDADALIDNAFMINCPLVLSSDNMQILETAIKSYTGRVIIDPECELTDISRAFFRTKYGVVLL